MNATVKDMITYYMEQHIVNKNIFRYIQEDVLKI